jgi:glutamate-1-semialdehyde 2,1-aminomutase
VYTGFRMAPGGAQEYYGVNADMVVYGKTLGGGMPVGVVCGKKELMRRFDPEHPLRVSYVIGACCLCFPFSAIPRRRVLPVVRP